MTKKIAILGAGISGLSLAYFLEKKSHYVTIFDKSHRVGGVVRTMTQNGFMYECGPHSVRVGPEEKELFKELGLQDELLFSHTTKKYLAQNGELARVPDSLLSLFCTEVGRICLKGLLLYPFRRKKIQDDETVASYFRRNFGEQFLDTIIDPMMAGIYAASPSELSFQACFLPFKNAKKAQVCSFKNGLQILIDAFLHKLRATLHLNTQVTHITDEHNGALIATDKGQEHFDLIFSTLPMQDAASLFPTTDPIHSFLPHIPRASLAAVHLGFYEDLLSPSKKGFGFLAAQKEESDLLGMIFASSIFPEQNQNFQTRLAILLGGTRSDVTEQTDDTLQQRALHFCKKYLQINQTPQISTVTRATNSLHLYPVHHLQACKNLETYLAQHKRPIRFFGAALSGVSLTSCISTAQKLASML